MNTTLKFAFILLFVALTRAEFNNKECIKACILLYSPICVRSSTTGMHCTLSNDCHLEVLQCQKPNECKIR